MGCNRWMNYLYRECECGAVCANVANHREGYASHRKAPVSHTPQTSVNVNYFSDCIGTPRNECSRAAWHRVLD